MDDICGIHTHWNIYDRIPKLMMKCKGHSAPENFISAVQQ